jgi:hypothetical protein
MTLANAIRLLMLVLVFTLLSGGCSSRRSAGQVSGKVTVRGQPLADIGVTFEPIGAGAGRGSFGRTDESGQYSLTFIDNNQAGASIGRHTVTFSDLQNVGGADEPDAGPSLPRRKSRLPPSATEQPHEFEVQAGDNEASFDLK